VAHLHLTHFLIGAKIFAAYFAGLLLSWGVTGILLAGTKIDTEMRILLSRVPEQWLGNDVYFKKIIVADRVAPSMSYRNLRAVARKEELPCG